MTSPLSNRRAARYEEHGLTVSGSTARARLRSATTPPRARLSNPLGVVPDPYGTGFLEQFRSDDGEATSILVWRLNPIRCVGEVSGRSLVGARWLYGPGPRRFAFTDRRGNDPTGEDHRSSEIRSRVYDGNGRLLAEMPGAATVVSHPRRTELLSLGWAPGSGRIVAHLHRGRERAQVVPLDRAVRGWLRSRGGAGEAGWYFGGFRPPPYGFLDHWLVPRMGDLGPRPVGPGQVYRDTLRLADRSVAHDREEYSGDETFAVTPIGDAVVTGDSLLDRRLPRTSVGELGRLRLCAVAWSAGGVRLWSVVPANPDGRGFLLFGREPR